MIIEVITFASGFAVGIVLDRNVRISASPESQRIAKRLLQTGLAQLPSADTVKGWVIDAVASARSKALPPVQEVSDEVLREIEFEARGVKFDELQKGFPPLPPLPLSEEEWAAGVKEIETDAKMFQEFIEKFDASQPSETSVLGSK